MGMTQGAFAVLTVTGFWLAIAGLVVAFWSNAATGGVTFGPAATAVSVALWVMGRGEMPG